MLSTFFTDISCPQSQSTSVLYEAADVQRDQNSNYIALITLWDINSLNRGTGIIHDILCGSWSSFNTHYLLHLYIALLILCMLWWRVKGDIVDSWLLLSKYHAFLQRVTSMHNATVEIIMYPKTTLFTFPNFCIIRYNLWFGRHYYPVYMYHANCTSKYVALFYRSEQ